MVYILALIYLGDTGGWSYSDQASVAPAHQSKMPVPVLTAANHSQFIAAHRVVLVLYTAASCLQSTTLEQTLSNVVPMLIPQAAVATCADMSLLSAADVGDAPVLRVHRTGMDSLVSEPFHGPLEPVKLAMFLRRLTRAHPLQVHTAADLTHALQTAELAAIRFTGVELPLAAAGEQAVTDGISQSATLSAFTALSRASSRNAAAAPVSQLFDFIIAPAYLLPGFVGGSEPSEALVMWRKGDEETIKQ